MDTSNETSSPPPARHQPFGIYLGEDRVLTRARDDIRLVLDTRDMVLTPALLIDGDWERELTDQIGQLLHPGMNFVDVGANIGYFSCVAGYRIGRGTGKIWAFEADPETFVYLNENINLNWFFEGVKLEQQAVYSHSCKLTLHRRKKYRGNTSIGVVPRHELDHVLDNSEPVEVPAVSLDDYFAGNTDRIDLLKIDVEGGEPFVLEGMRRLLVDQPEMRILIEWSPNQIWKTGVDPKQMIAFLDEQGFAMREVGGGPITIADLGNIGHANLLLER